MAKAGKDEMRSEYDLSQLGGRVRGKYHRQALAGTNLVLIEPDLVEAFPNQESVNRALRLLATTARAAMRGSRKPRKTRNARGKQGQNGLRLGNRVARDRGGQGP